MQILDDVGFVFGDISVAAGKAANYCDSVPVLGDALVDYFWKAQSFFWSIRSSFFSLSSSWDSMAADIGNILSWSTIQGYISSTWDMTYDLAGDITQGARNLITSQYPEIIDFWGNVAQGVRNTITAEYSEIADFWGNVAAGVSSWFDANFEPWIEARADRVISLAGRVLDKVW